MTVWSSELRLPRTRFSAVMISGPHLTSMYSRFPFGMMARSSARVGIFSPANFAAFHFPASRARSSSSV